VPPADEPRRSAPRDQAPRARPLVVVVPTGESSWYVRPVFFVTDCEEALRFYCDLGFREAWRHEERGRVVAVQVNRVLNENPVRAGGGRLFLSLHRGQVAKCVDSFVAAGVEVRDDHWGMPVKVVSDRDGNDLMLFDDDLAGS
jgi:catechol 2,3-dioxygenase-like lactoylglutathione lyase family enzyme